MVHLHNLGLTSSSAADDGDIVGSACRQCAKYSSTSSNLAAYCLHVARMIRDLQSSLETYSTADSNKSGDIDETITSSSAGNGNPGGTNSVKQRISLIGKARVTCGALNLLRILSHETIVHACSPRPEASTQSSLEYDTNYILSECFTYRSRDKAGNTSGQDAAMEIVASVMCFLSSIGRSTQHGKDTDMLAIPELYDVIVQLFSLLLVLLSTQLYQPMVSSTELAMEGQRSSNLFLEKWMEYSSWQRQQYQAQNLGQESTTDGHQMIHNESLLFLHLCLHWLVIRPSPPRRSIASHYVELPKSIAQQMTNMTISPDGMYESHSIVMASISDGSAKKATTKAAPHTKISLESPASQTKADGSTSIALGTDDTIELSSAGHVSGDVNSWNGPTNMILHPLRSLLMLSSTFFLLPIRLVRLAFHLLGHSHYRAIAGDSSHNSADGDKLILQQIQAHCEKETGWNKTNNILWLTDAPISDLSSAVLLLLSNNCRVQGSNEGSSQNPFRAELDSLSDNRWEQSAKDQSTDENSLFYPPSSNSEQLSTLSINFETLFEAFGRIAHTEVGALLLYTFLLSSPTLASSIAARSDLDTLVMPLLRSLYFSTTMAPVGPTNTTKSGQLSQLITLTPSTRPFRSQSQLYVILILLLLFSQDPSLGRDSFRRVTVPNSSVKWYKEKKIKDASLGSMILLVLLRATSFNLNRLQDAFLLSNCAAVLLNLSPHAVNLNDYVATRLISVTTSCFKRYATLLAQNGGEAEIEGDLTSLLGMHGEVSNNSFCQSISLGFTATFMRILNTLFILSCTLYIIQTCRTLLQLVRHAIRPKYLEKNIQVVYALLLEQREFQKMCQREYNSYA